MADGRDGDASRLARWPAGCRPAVGPRLAGLRMDALRPLWAGGSKGQVAVTLERDEARVTRTMRHLMCWLCQVGEWRLKNPTPLMERRVRRLHR